MSPTSENPATPPVPLTATRIAEMKLVDNGANPTVMPVGKITSSWTGHILEKDDGKYTDWAYTMKLELTMVQLWDYIFDPPPHPHETYEPRACRAWASNRRLACSFLKRAISTSEQKLCAEEEDPVVLWSYLKERHGGATPVKQVRLLQEALTTKCSLSEPLTKTVDMIFERIDRAFDAGDVTKDLLKSIAVLSALSDKSFSHLRSIISRDLGQAGSMVKYGPAEIRKFLEGEQTLMEADRTTATPQDSDPTALIVKPYRGSNLTCSACKARKRPVHVYTGHTAPWCILEGGGMAGKTAEESKRARLAHYESIRKDKSKKISKITFTPAGGNAFTLEGDSETIAAYLATKGSTTSPPAKQEFAGLTSDEIPSADTLVTAEDLEIDAWIVLEEEKTDVEGNHNQCPELILSCETHSDPFFLDSGATVHISPDASDFVTLDPIHDKPIRGVGGSCIVATGVGTIRLHIDEHTHIELENVLHVPKSTVRLLSVSKLAQQVGIETTFDDTKAILSKKTDGKTIATGTLIPKRGLYALDLLNPQALAVHAAPNIKSWHLRLGHANYQSIMQMARAGMIKGMPSSFPSKPPKCNHCILGKQSKTSVPREREEGIGHRATKRLEKVWVDLSGPTAVTSRTGNNYIMNVVDDYTNKPWSIPLKTKDEGFCALKAWVLARENETGERLKILRTGRDGEFNGDEHKEWYRRQGIILEVGAPYTSAHMGRVERMHRTLMGKARAMRLAANCPPFLWDEFYLTAAHLHGKTKTSAVRDATPDELWYQKKPNYSYIREIGCRAFVLILNKHNPKVFERSIECVLIGYDSNSKAYRCYDRSTKKVYSSYHVRFIESHNDEPTASTPMTNPMQQPHANSHAPEMQTMNSIAMNASKSPAEHIDDNEDSYPNMPGVLNQIMPAAQQPDNPTIDDHAPVPQIRRSTRTVIPTAKVSGDDRAETRTERAVRESKEAAGRVKATRAEHRRDAENGDAIEDQPHNLDRILSVLNTIEDQQYLDPESDFETPRTWEEARNSPDGPRWEQSYREELTSLKEMGVWKLIPREEVPRGHRVLKGRPVFAIKRDESGKITRFKTRHVVQGFNQVYGRDYTRTTSPTARAESWRILLHLAASLGWDANQIDVKTAFLNGVLPEEETVYMEQPKGFEEPGKENWVCQLIKGLYGMKQAGRIWNKTLDGHMKKWGFTRLDCEACVYYRKTKVGAVIVGVHVDDFLAIASTRAANEEFKKEMAEAWTIADLGTPKHILGIAVNWDRDAHQVHLSQTMLIDRLVQQFGQSDATPLSTPMDPGTKLRRVDLTTLSPDEREKITRIPYRRLVGGLLWLAVSTRPDIQYAVQQLSQYLDCYTQTHWNAAIRTLRYLKGTRTLGLSLGGKQPITLLGFTDSDWANCLDTRRSVGGYAWTLGSGVISWSTRKQRTVAASSCEAEYMAAFEATQECIWLRALMTAIGYIPTGPTTLLCDNNSAINLSEDPMLHQRVKHVDIKYHFLRERVASKEITIQYINTKDNVADIFTKALHAPQFSKLRAILGIKDSARGGV